MSHANTLQTADELLTIPTFTPHAQERTQLQEQVAVYASRCARLEAEGAHDASHGADLQALQEAHADEIRWVRLACIVPITLRSGDLDKSGITINSLSRSHVML